MRYAVLSDIHANLEALEAVLADAAERAESLLCLGDVVGYGADPEACLELIAGRAAALVAGNHEHGVVGRLDLDWFNDYARAAVEWTRDRLDEDHRSYLAALPLVAEVGDATLVHASPERPEEWDYLVSPQDGFAAFPAFATRLCFVGHSHLPAAWSLGSSGPEFVPGAGELSFEPGRRYIVNVGSVGQPRDRDPRAAYALWDAERGRLAIRRVTYDVDTARRKILAGGLPRLLADRLPRGA
ncbi:MAG: metallophosphoesterase family protein [Candidatus Rokubacteria bacterium]|nr:metallophosphoesterase family protein [Candidatus Rokubacteria bacterium]